MNINANELKEFWQWCGLTHKLHSDGETEYWYKEGKLVTFRCPAGLSGGAIPLTLNNLFMLAVPKISSRPEIQFKTGYPFSNSLRCEIWTNLPSGNIQSVEYDYIVKTGTVWDDSHYAMALYYAIDKLRCTRELELLASTNLD